MECTRDKSGSEGAQWAFKLVQVPEVPRPVDMDPPAVCIPMDEDELRVLAPAFEHDDNWNDPAQPDLPNRILTFSGRGGNAIRPLARFMRYSAHATTSLRGALTEHKGKSHTRLIFLRIVRWLSTYKGLFT